MRNKAWVLFAAIVRYDLTIASRERKQLLPVSIAAIAFVLVGFATFLLLGLERKEALFLTASIQIIIFFVFTNLSIQRRDAKDGALEQMLVAASNPTVILFARAVTLCLLAGAPAALLGGVGALICGFSAKECALFIIALMLGTFMLGFLISAGSVLRLSNWRHAFLQPPAGNESAEALIRRRRLDSNQIIRWGGLNR